MLKDYISILAFFILLGLASCGAKKQVAQEQQEHPQEREQQAQQQAKPRKHDKAAAAKYSKLFGVRVTKDDDIRLYAEASKWLGVRHKYGGSTRSGVDCSGFVMQVFKEVYGKPLYRSSAEMLTLNCRRVKRDRLKEGDLVFFHTGGGKKNKANHVGIYLKNGRFVHTSTSKGVMVSSLSEPYFVRAWLAAGRVK